MSHLEFRIDDWVQAEDPDPRRSNTAAEFVLLVDGIPATRQSDSWSRTVTDRARLPLYPLAEWFAANWWRLHAEAPYEAGSRPPPDWRLSHDLGAIGGGFIWPRVRFASDNVAIQVSARAMRNAPWEPVRYLNDISARAVPVEAFDEAVESLISMVLGRLRDLKLTAEPLATIWADVLAERSDPEVAAWRRWEARLGYDADEAPDGLTAQIQDFSDRAGSAAAAELAPVLYQNETAMIGRLTNLALTSGIEAKFSEHVPVPITSPGMPPWDAGRQLAHQVRARIGHGTGPLDDHVVSELLGVSSDLSAIKGLVECPIGLGVRFPAQHKTVLHFRKRNLPGIRFEAARFLAESLTAPREDHWLPLTDRTTARQKFQRAFAAEFLVPIEELQELLSGVQTSDRFEDAGEFYGVSPLAIRSHLANHDLLAPGDVAGQPD